MIETLYVVRHGIAFDYGERGYSEFDRPLTDEGRDKMKRIGKALRERGVEPDAIVSSPLIRAFQTAQILHEELRVETPLIDDYALAASRPVEHAARFVKELRHVRPMIVGHNMGLSELISVLTVGHSSPLLTILKKGGMAALKAGGLGTYELLWLATPRLILGS